MFFYRDNNRNNTKLPVLLPYRSRMVSSFLFFELEFWYNPSKYLPLQFFIYPYHFLFLILCDFFLLLFVYKFVKTLYNTLLLKEVLISECLYKLLN